MAATKVGTISKAALFASLPEELPIKRGSNTRLFVQSPWGGWMLNTKAGQAFLEANATLNEREPPAPIPAPEPEQKNEAPAEPEAAPENETSEKGLLNWLMSE